MSPATVRAVPSFNNHMSRRSLLIGGVAGAIATRAGLARTPRLETLTQWLNASPREREAALQQCLDRIREMDPSIHAWVQVSPQKQIHDGKLAGIPFGAKDIIETRGLATEYGSSIYKGRVGTTDAAIIREQSCSEKP
jgi:Asp-tRNA(Asn)/Glu-tRNA(Gln) amidotransferase A subunit family amidase